MPIYSYRCAPCEHSFEVFRSVAQMQQQEPCEQCGGLAQKQLTVPMVSGDLTSYSCPITGKPIDGWRAHRENLKQHGCRVYEKGETETFIKRKAGWEKLQRDQLVDKVVDSTAKSMGIIG